MLTIVVLLALCSIVYFVVYTRVTICQRVLADTYITICRLGGEIVGITMPPYIPGPTEIAYSTSFAIESRLTQTQSAMDCARLLQVSPGMDENVVIGRVTRADTRLYSAPGFGYATLELAQVGDTYLVLTALDIPDSVGNIDRWYLVQLSDTNCGWVIDNWIEVGTPAVTATLRPS